MCVTDFKCVCMLDRSSSQQEKEHSKKLKSQSIQEGDNPKPTPYSDPTTAHEPSSNTQAQPPPPFACQTGNIFK